MSNTFTSLHQVQDLTIQMIVKLLNDCLHFHLLQLFCIPKLPPSFPTQSKLPPPSIQVISN